MEMRVVESSRLLVLCLQAVLLTAAAIVILGQPEPVGVAATACTSQCGNISIEYPFGVEAGCYHAVGFNLTCNSSYHPPRLFLGDGAVQVLDISIPNATVRVNSSKMVFREVNNTDGSITLTPSSVPWPAWGGPYVASETNRIALVGCNSQVSLLAQVATSNGSKVVSKPVSTCIAQCPAVGEHDEGIAFTTAGPGTGYDSSLCSSGIGCCQAGVLSYSSYRIQIDKLEGRPGSIVPMDTVYILDQELNYTNDMAFGGVPEALPALFNWFVVSSSTCSTDPTTKTNTTLASAAGAECRSNHSICQDYYSMGTHHGYLCFCSQGYRGNPYVAGGCQDIDECKTPNTYGCYGQCDNTEGGFLCQCPLGFEGNASIPNGCKDIDECADRDAYPCYGICVNMHGTYHCHCHSGTDGDPTIKGGCKKIKHPISGLLIGLIVGGGIGFLTLALAAPFITHKLKLHNMERMKQKFFKQNHGLLLQQLMSQNADIGQRMIMTLRELEKATDNFNKTREVGGGGHGIVYKGILDLHVVAIKKSRIVVQREIDDFINEVAILSQVNHRNVVKLLGCCLEAEVPLLIYEFISNGSLDHHLHVNGPVSLPWDDRIRIAHEIARALSYLHSDCTIPIFHRDIKASNILLDDNLTAKISDFGASRYIPIDQTGVTTAVQGTIGYLDPMYYYTGRLTGKSDVFSFGVLLIELLTRRKPTYRTDEGDSLVLHFASLLKEDKLVEIIDPQVMEEDGSVQEIAALAAMCTNLNGQDRPAMREVERTLENLRVKLKLTSHNAKSSRRGVSQVASYCMSAEVDSMEV